MNVRKAKELYVTNRDDWRRWLKENHASAKEVWLIYYKKHTSKPTIPYDDAVEEALCYGWIDSIIRRIDDERYARKFTPRNEGSRWSELNKKRAKKMIKQGRMTEAGLVKIKAAKRNGQWSKIASRIDLPKLPVELLKALAQNKKAKKYFEQLAPSYRKHYIFWIASAKRDDTRQRRIKEAVSLLERNEKLGMK